MNTKQITVGADLAAKPVVVTHSRLEPLTQ